MGGPFASVQDLEFSTASSRVKLSPDGNYLCVTGIHPPQIKVYDLSQLSMKFERHLDAEVGGSSTSSAHFVHSFMYHTSHIALRRVRGALLCCFFFKKN